MSVAVVADPTLVQDVVSIPPAVVPRAYSYFSIPEVASDPAAQEMMSVVATF